MFILVVFVIAIQKNELGNPKALVTNHGRTIKNESLQEVQRIGFPGGTVVKNYPAMQETQRCGFYPWVRKIPWRRKWQATPVILPGESHGQRSLVGYIVLGFAKELDTTERLHFHFLLSCIGKGNGSPLQCSCLENSRDGGAWWASVYGVAQSRTRLK